MTIKKALCLGPYKRLFYVSLSSCFYMIGFNAMNKKISIRLGKAYTKYIDASFERFCLLRGLDAGETFETVDEDSALSFMTFVYQDMEKFESDADIEKYILSFY